MRKIHAVSPSAACSSADVVPSSGNAIATNAPNTNAYAIEPRAHRSHCYAILIDLILSPILIPFTTSMPLVTCPKFVYCLSRNGESRFTTKN